jgi:N-acetylmuramoyl-L-alanine amidase
VPQPPRVGIQVGHWKTEELPEELARLRTSSGAYAGGVWEWELNYDIARRVEALLSAEGVTVDVLPATVPPGYLADAFVALHADGVSGGAARGYKLATPWRSSRAAQALHDALVAEYGAATGLERDGNITRNMRGYYAFSYRRHEHAVNRLTPAVIVEMGFLTSAADREILLGQPERVAQGVANGVLRYLRERDPADTAALEPPEFPQLQAGPAGAEVLAAPEAGARVLASIPPGRRVFAFAERDGWLQVTVGGQWNVVGWLPRQAVEIAPASTPLPTEPPRDS